MHFEDCDLGTISIPSTLHKQLDLVDNYMNTDSLKTSDASTEPKEVISKECQTDKQEKQDSDQHILIDAQVLISMERCIENSLATKNILDRLNKFHATNDVQLQELRITHIAQLNDDNLDVMSVVCGVMGRVAYLIGMNEHESWCTHDAKIVIAQRSKVNSIAIGVCPTVAKWSPNGLLAVGNTNGEVLLISGDAILSTNKIHSLGVSCVEWVSATVILSTSLDGSIVLSSAKSTQLQTTKTIILTVADLPRKHKKSSSSTKPVGIVSLHVRVKDALLCTETGGLFVLTVPELELKNISCDPQTEEVRIKEANRVKKHVDIFVSFVLKAIIRVLNYRPLCLVLPQDSNAKILSFEGAFLDTLSIQATMAELTDNELAVLSDGRQLIIYSFQLRREVLVEQIACLAMGLNNHQELVIVTPSHQIVTYRIIKK